MWPLTKLDSDAVEDKKLSGILNKAEFKPHAIAWQQAYAHYRACQGNPWQIVPLSLPKPVSDAQYALYDSRKNGGPLNRIRHMPGILCCTMCGSPTLGSLDHYLPRRQFPEFAVFPSNLVPACTHCNSGAKQSIFKGAQSSERFLHPYFDKHGAKILWHVAITKPYEAPTFTPEPDPGVAQVDLPMVRFHLANIFGEQYYTQTGTYWTALPQVLGDLMNLLQLSVDQALAAHLLWCCNTGGQNGWQAALIRGIQANPDASAFVAAQTAAWIANNKLPQLVAAP